MYLGLVLNAPANFRAKNPTKTPYHKVKTLIITYTSSLILGAVSFLPGGIGVTEGTLVGLFSLQNIDISTAVVLVVFIRIFILWYSVIVGFISLKISRVFS